jgi:hypothetical protein
MPVNDDTESGSDVFESDNQNELEEKGGDSSLNLIFLPNPTCETTVRDKSDYDNGVVDSDNGNELEEKREDCATIDEVTASASAEEIDVTDQLAAPLAPSAEVALALPAVAENTLEQPVVELKFCQQFRDGLCPDDVCPSGLSRCISRNCTMPFTCSCLKHHSLQTLEQLGSCNGASCRSTTHPCRSYHPLQHVMRDFPAPLAPGFSSAILLIDWHWLHTSMELYNRKRRAGGLSQQRVNFTRLATELVRMYRCQFRYVGVFSSTMNVLVCFFMRWFSLCWLVLFINVCCCY